MRKMCGAAKSRRRDQKWRMEGGGTTGEVSKVTGTEDADALKSHVVERSLVAFGAVRCAYVTRGGWAGGYEESECVGRFPLVWGERCRLMRRETDRLSVRAVVACEFLTDFGENVCCKRKGVSALL